MSFCAGISYFTAEATVGMSVAPYTGPMAGSATEGL